MLTAIELFPAFFLELILSRDHARKASEMATAPSFRSALIPSNRKPWVINLFWPFLYQKKAGQDNGRENVFAREQDVIYSFLILFAHVVNKAAFARIKYLLPFVLSAQGHRSFRLSRIAS